MSKATENVKYILGVKDRLILGGILQKCTGNFATLKVVHQTIMDASLSEEELKLLNFRQDKDGRSMWDASREQLKSINIPDAVVNLVWEQLEALDKNNALTIDHVGLYQAFIKAREEFEVAPDEDDSVNKTN